MLCVCNLQRIIYMRTASFSDVGLSSEAVLQLLQRFLYSRNHIKQIHGVVVTAGALVPSRLKTTFIYNTLIRSYLNMGHYNACLVLFNHMLVQPVEPNNLTFPSLIKAASSSSFSLSGIALHGQALKWGVLWDPFVQTSFVRYYTEIGNSRSSGKMFDEIKNPCIVACNSLLYAYGRNGDMDSALKLFRRMPIIDVVSWTTIINAFTKNGFHDQALTLFGEMVDEEHKVIPNEATFVSVLSSCANFDKGGIFVGKEIHGYIIRKEIIISTNLGTALIVMYGKAGNLGMAFAVFDQMYDNKEICTWNAMISALASNGRSREALAMFEMMKSNGFQPNEVTFVAVLTACARSKLVEIGLESFRSMWDEHNIIPTQEHYGCVVDLLGRAGFLIEAVNLVKSLPFDPDPSVLGALMGACKIHEVTGLGNEVGKRLLELQPRHCSQYMALWTMNALEKKWEDAAELRNVMKQSRVRKIPAYSVVCAV